MSRSLILPGSVRLAGGNSGEIKFSIPDFRFPAISASADPSCRMQKARQTLFHVVHFILYFVYLNFGDNRLVIYKYNQFF